MSNLKNELYKQCINYVKECIDTATVAIEASRQAANEETKSSAGDKYETGRAMMDQETDRHQGQLNAANKLLVALDRININAVSETADAGSLVVTNNGKFYIAISAGMLKVDGEVFFAVSPASPIGLKLKGQKAGSEFDLNGKVYTVQEIV